jgi:hypothetical protein
LESNWRWNAWQIGATTGDLTTELEVVRPLLFAQLLDEPLYYLAGIPLAIPDYHFIWATQAGELPSSPFQLRADPRPGTHFPYGHRVFPDRP